MTDLVVRTYLQELTAAFLENGFADIRDKRKEAGLVTPDCLLWRECLSEAGLGEDCAVTERYGRCICCSRQQASVLSYHNGALREYLSEKLPEYMVPQNYHFMEQLPTLSNGKINRKQLREDFKEETAVIRFSKATTETEEKLLDIWKQLFGYENIGIEDNYFSLGGDSLIATRLISEVQKTFGCKITISTIFENLTVKSLAKAIEQSEQKEEDAVFRYDKRENYDIEIIIRDAREVTRFVSGLSEVEGILFYGWSEGVRVCTTLVSDFPNAQALILQSGIAEGWSSYFSYILRELTVEKLKELDNNNDSILEISDFLNCIPDSTSISFSLYLLILGTDKEGNMKFNEELDPEGKGRFSIIDNWIPLADEIVADPTTLIRFAENAPGETWAGILDDIKKIQLPILVLHGLNDGWISPVEAVQIAKAARNNADIILFKGLGHSLSKVSSPLKDEGGTIEDEVIVRVVEWLKKNVE